MSQLDDLPLADARTNYESVTKLKSPINNVIDLVLDTTSSLYEIIVCIDEFQLQILQFLFIITCLTGVCIWISWRKYGSRITERFMKPGSNRILEDLRAEATELKLPKEHTPRI